MGDVKKLATVFGVVLLLVGVLGFVPGVVTEDGLLLGIFAVDLPHNLIHLVTGGAALAAAKTEEYARTYFKVFGVVYLLVTLLGFMMAGPLLGFVANNTADNFLHLAIAVLALAVGFGGSTAKRPVQV